MLVRRKASSVSIALSWSLCAAVGSAAIDVASLIASLPASGGFPHRLFKAEMTVLSSVRTPKAEIPLPLDYGCSQLVPGPIGPLAGMGGSVIGVPEPGSAPG